MSRRSKLRARHSAAEWQHFIELQRSSGESQTAFCQSQGLGLSTFQYWKRRLRAASPPQEPPPPWLELSALPERRGEGWEIELELGGGLYLRLSRR